MYLSFSARRCPSFCQVILGEGLPLATQSIAATSFTSTVTSSGRSPSTALMVGGTTEEQKARRIPRLCTSQCFLLHFCCLRFKTDFLDWVFKRVVESSVNTVEASKIPQVIHLEQISVTLRTAGKLGLFTAAIRRGGEDSISR